jgi:hypothetical protein
MIKKIKIEVKRPSRRIPVPQKPPRIEEGRKRYNRNKEKIKSRTLISGD